MDNYNSAFLSSLTLNVVEQTGKTGIAKRLLAPLPLSLFGESEDDAVAAKEQAVEVIVSEGFADDDEFGDFESVPAGLAAAILQSDDSQRRVGDHDGSLFGGSVYSAENAFSSESQAPSTSRPPEIHKHLIGNFDSVTAIATSVSSSSTHNFVGLDSTSGETIVVARNQDVKSSEDYQDFLREFSLFRAGFIADDLTKTLHAENELNTSATSSLQTKPLQKNKPSEVSDNFLGEFRSIAVVSTPDRLTLTDVNLDSSPLFFDELDSVTARSTLAVTSTTSTSRTTSSAFDDMFGGFEVVSTSQTGVADSHRGQALGKLVCKDQSSSGQQPSLVDGAIDGLQIMFRGDSGNLTQADEQVLHSADLFTSPSDEFNFPYTIPAASPNGPLPSSETFSSFFYSSGGQRDEILSDDDWGDFVAPPPPSAFADGVDYYSRDLLVTEQVSSSVPLNIVDKSNSRSSSVSELGPLEVRILTAEGGAGADRDLTFQSSNQICLGTSQEFVEGSDQIQTLDELQVAASTGFSQARGELQAGEDSPGSDRIRDNSQLEGDVFISTENLPLNPPLQKAASHSRSRSLVETSTSPLPLSFIDEEEVLSHAYYDTGSYSTGSRMASITNGTAKGARFGKKPQVSKAVLSRSRSLVETSAAPLPLSLFGEDDISFDVDFDFYTGKGRAGPCDLDSEDDMPFGRSADDEAVCTDDSDDSIFSSTNEEDLHKLKLLLIGEGRVQEALACTSHASVVQSLSSLQEEYGRALKSEDYDRAAVIMKNIEAEEGLLVNTSVWQRWQRRLIGNAKDGFAVQHAGSMYPEMLSPNRAVSKLTLDDMLKLLGGVGDKRRSVFDVLFLPENNASLAKRDLRATAELHTRAIETFQVLVSATVQQQLLYVKAWSALISACADELELGSRFWQRAVAAQAQMQLLSYPQGRSYFAALGQVYVVHLILQATVKLHEPWLRVAGEQGRALSSAIDMCQSYWVRSNLKEAVFWALNTKGKSSSGHAFGTSWEDIQDIEIVVTIAAAKGPAIIAAENQGQPLCGLSLLPLLSPALLSVEWGSRKYLLPLANLWANCVQSKPPDLPVLLLESS